MGILNAISVGLSLIKKASNSFSKWRKKRNEKKIRKYAKDAANGDADSVRDSINKWL